MKHNFADNYKGEVFCDLAPHYLGILKYEEILHYYDGPAAFFASNNNKLNFFVVWHDNDEHTDQRIWLLSLIPEHISLDFKNGIISMLDVYENSIEVWLITESNNMCLPIDDDFELDNITFEAWREWYHAS